MSVTIDSNLLTFKDKISPALGSIPGVVSSLQSKLDEINSATSTATTSISSCYNGEGLSSVNNAFKSTSAAVEGIKGSLADGPNKVISLSSELINDIKSLEDLKKEIESLEEEISRLTSAASSDNMADRINSRKAEEKKSELRTKETDFKTKHDAAKAKLDEIKNINPEIDIKPSNDVNIDFTGTPLSDLSGLTPGSYTKHSYTAANGQTFDYWIYVPENITSIEDLPVHMYFTGSGEAHTGKCNNNSLPKYISEGLVKPNGIVITFEAHNNNDYLNANYMDAYKELTDNVVTTFKANPKKISASGHSLGGIATLLMGARYPDYFSVIAPVCGYYNHFEKATGSLEQSVANLTKVNILSVVGTNDEYAYSSMQRLYKRMEATGNMLMCPIKGASHRNTYFKYKDQITINGKTYNNLMEYIFEQSRA